MATRATATHMSSSFHKLHPPFSGVAGSFRVVTRLFWSSVTIEARLVSCDPTDHFKLLPGPQEASHAQCVCVCVSSREGVSCLSIFRPDWSEWVAVLLPSWISPSLVFSEFTAWRQNDTLSYSSRRDIIPGPMPVYKPRMHTTDDY